MCKGGPSKPNCGRKVTDGVDAVECEKCLNWFHCKCQGISKPALNALRKWHGTLLWLCDKCTEAVKEKTQPICECNKIKSTVSKLEQITRQNATKLNESIQNQEKIFATQCKVLDKVMKISTNEELQQKNYADAVKGVGAQVVEQVSKKFDKIPAASVPVQRSNEEVACLLDEIQDKECCKLNVVIHNLREADGQSYAERTKGDGEAFKNMAKEGLKLIVEATRTFRVGKKEGTKPRLMVVTLTNIANKVEILRAAASLRDTKWNNIYITPDLTWKEREKGRQLRSELVRRKEAGEENIWIRQGRIVPIPEEKLQKIQKPTQNPEAQHIRQGSSSPVPVTAPQHQAGSKAPQAREVASTLEERETAIIPKDSSHLPSQLPLSATPISAPTVSHDVDPTGPTIHEGTAPERDLRDDHAGATCQQ